MARRVGNLTTQHSTPPTTSVSTSGHATQERTDLVDVLRKHRALFRLTVSGLTDEQARLTPTVSTLSLGGLVKHVTAVEQQWATFVVEGPAPSPRHRLRTSTGRIRRPRSSSMPTASGCSRTRAWPVSSRRRTRWPLPRTNSCSALTSTRCSRSPRLPGSSQVRRGALGEPSRTSWLRPPSTPASSARPSTARNPWADTSLLQRGGLRWPGEPGHVVEPPPAPYGRELR